MFTQILTLALTSVLATSGVAAEPIEQISYEDTTSTATISYELSASESNDITLENGDILIMSDEETSQDVNQSKGEKEGKGSLKEELAEMKQAMEDKVAGMKADIEAKLAEMKAGLADKAEAMKSQLEEKKAQLAEKKTQLANKTESMKSQLADKAESMKSALADKADGMKQNREGREASDVA